jgi:UDP-N-acetylmuramoylalanine--D-glutamate ligase
MSAAPRALVYGLAVAGSATVSALLRRGFDVMVADDRVDDHKRALADRLGVELVDRPSDADVVGLVRGCAIVSPAPGVPETHRVVRAALDADVPLRSEIDLAYEWEQSRAGGARPILTVTGTDGKTTTTLLAVHLLAAAGRRAVACGNTDVPLVDAIETDVDVLVVEAASFRLAWTPTFRSDAAAWLNLAEDHQDWHVSMSSYERAKSRIWANMRDTDVAIGAASDKIVMRNLDRVAGRRVTFGSEVGDYKVVDGRLVSPHGDICHIADLPRRLPHDVTNALCASALVIESGQASLDAVRDGLADFRSPAHRIELVAEHGGIAYYDDSKATTPHAALTAIRGFDSVVLIAGGRNKGLDLGSMAAESERIRSVVTIGESADEIAVAFSGRCPVIAAGDMATAVRRAAEIARSGDVVLLSPGCASYDQYDGYAARGDDFARHVRAFAEVC